MTIPRPSALHEMIETSGEHMWQSLRESLVRHPGELGAGRERVVREFLAKYLPKRFGVSHGFVFDATGAISEQMDVVVYDDLECPVFLSAGNVRFFPCEAVVCVGQVKSSITSSGGDKNCSRHARHREVSTTGSTASTRRLLTSSHDSFRRPCMRRTPPFEHGELRPTQGPPPEREPERQALLDGLWKVGEMMIEISRRHREAVRRLGGTEDVAFLELVDAAQNEGRRLALTGGGISESEWLAYVMSRED